VQFKQNDVLEDLTFHVMADLHVTQNIKKKKQHGMGYPVPGGNKYKNLTLQVEGVLKTETTKYAYESHGTHT
jgi:hypothetical protein